MIVDRSSQLLSRGFLNPATWLILVFSIAVSSCQTHLPDALPTNAKVVVLFSAQSKPEKQLVRALKQRLGQRMSVYHARGNRRRDKQWIREQAKSENRQIVAIGRQAALLAKQAKNGPVSISRVYNISSAGLNGKRFSTVSVLPDPESALWTVRLLNPSIKSLGIVTAPGLKQTMARIRKVAASKKIRLIHKVAKSDKEFLFLSRQISRDVDAFWLLPDDRILSRSSIREFMSHAVKQGKQVITFNANFLKLGALVSIEPSQDATAELLHTLVLSNHYLKDKSESGLQFVKKTNISISKLSANRLGIKIPDSMKKYIHE